MTVRDWLSFLPALRMGAGKRRTRVRKLGGAGNLPEAPKPGADGRQSKVLKDLICDRRKQCGFGQITDPPASASGSAQQRRVSQRVLKYKRTKGSDVPLWQMYRLNPTSDLRNCLRAVDFNRPLLDRGNLCDQRWL